MKISIINISKLISFRSIKFIKAKSKELKYLLNSLINKLIIS